MRLDRLADWPIGHVNATLQLFFRRLRVVFELLFMPKCLIHLFYRCPCLPARDLGSRISGIVPLLAFPFSPWIFTEDNTIFAAQFMVYKQKFGDGVFISRNFDYLTLNRGRPFLQEFQSNSWKVSLLINASIIPHCFWYGIVHTFSVPSITSWFKVV